MKKTRFSSLTALALLGGSAWAASPYDVPYGVQWSFINGTPDQNDNPAAVAASSDGTVWFSTMGRAGAGPSLPWNNPKAGLYNGNYTSGYGQIGALGQIMQGNDIPAVPNWGGGQGQCYMRGITMTGTTANISWGLNKDGAYWTGQPSSGNLMNPMTVSIATVATPQGAPYPNAGGLSNQWNVPLYSSGGGSAGDSVVDSTGKWYFVGCKQLPNLGLNGGSGGDSFTIGDFSDASGSNYSPYVGAVASDGTTLSGPAHQPACDGRSYFADVDINESLGRVYAAGYSFASGTALNTYFDIDGPGPLAADAFSPTADAYRGYWAVYDSSWNILHHAVWESTEGGEGVFDITATTDGGFVAAGTTEGNLKSGATNPSPGTRDSYVAKYDNTGALVWDWQSQTPEYDYAGDATVDPDGNIYISGYRGTSPARDPFLIKFAADGTLVWTSIIDNGGTDDLAVDHGNVDKRKVYVLSVHNPSGGGNPWVNTISYVPAGSNENLLQKLIPGDFDDGTGTGTSDGFVNFDDVQYVGMATKPGLTGVDTYDFNEDGDSTLADTTYMITDIMDYVVGDIHAGTPEPLTDVDNADIGKAIGSYTGAAGSGKGYLDGDIDFDGDVDNDDVTSVAGAFTGALAPAGGQAAGTIGATLLYSADDGQIWISADEATGGIITSFQLENNQGTFAPASYAGPVGGNFGGSLKEVTADVIADTDLSLTGVTGVISLGKVFPTGMDQAGLVAYLTTAVYTGQPGSGQMQFNPVIVVLPVDFDTWAATFPGLTDPDASLDFELDGLETGVEYVVGGNPTLNDAAAVAPGASRSGSELAFTFRRTDLANNDPTTAIVVEYGSDLSTWTAAQPDVDGVTIVENDDFYGPGIDQVAVTLPPSLAVDGRIFARLKVTITPPLLKADFEKDDGGFTEVNSTGTPWAWGAPNSPTQGGGAVTEGNNSSAKCWGTNLLGGYIAGTDTSLRSPVIDLTGVTAATLSFARAIDALIADPKHTLEVNVIDATTLATTTVIAPFEDPDLDTTPWVTISVPIPAEALGKSVYLEWRFIGIGDGDYLGAYIDDVVVTAP